MRTTTLAARDWLQQNYFIHWEAKDGAWTPTDLGLACTAAGMDPEQALALKEDLLKAADGFFLRTELHKCFLITPDEVAEEVCRDWAACFRVIEGMDKVLLFCGFPAMPARPKQHCVAHACRRRRRR